MIDNRRAGAATKAAFFIIGFAAAAWAPLVPFAKARLGIDAGGLGLILLCGGLGSVATMAGTGALVGRVGARRVIVTASLVLLSALPVLAVGRSIPMMVGAMLAFGAAMGAIDVAANVQGIAVERAAGRPMMSGFHGFWSIGGISGAVLASGLIGAGAAPLAAALAVSGLALAVLAFYGRHLMGPGARPEGPAIAWPRGIVWLLAALALVMFLVEGAVADWSAVFLTLVRRMPVEKAGFGFAAFSLAMTAGRLAGDKIVAALGGGRVVLLGGLLAAAGFLIAIAAPFWPVSLAAFALVGAGCANIVPVLFTAAGQQRAMPVTLAVPAVTTIAYGGILAGPALVGFVARGAGLSAAFGLLGGLLVVVGAAGLFLKPGEHSQALAPASAAGGVSGGAGAPPGARP